MFANIKTFSYTRSMAEARRPARLLYARSIELKTRSCNELISGFYRASFSVLSPSVGKPNCRTAFSVLLEQFGALHNSKAFPRLELFTYTGRNYNLKLYTQTTEGPKMATGSELVARPGFQLYGS